MIKDKIYKILESPEWEINSTVKEVIKNFFDDKDAWNKLVINGTQY
ncbi:MAG: hypothetical protein ABIG69_06430 [Bacteroidota bacterium]